MTICISMRKPNTTKSFVHTLTIIIYALCTILTSSAASAQQPNNKSPSSSKAANASKAEHACPSTIPSGRKNDAAYLAIQGVKCFDAGDYSRAYALYNRAQGLEPNPTLYGAIGRVLHELGIYELAAIHYHEYLQLNQSSDDNGTQMIRHRLAQLDELLEKQAGTIEVSSAPSQATVFMVLPNKDWLELGQTPLKLDAQTGKYQLIVVHDGFYRQKHDINLSRNGKTVSVHADLVTEDSTFNVNDRQWRRAGAWTMIAGAPVFITGVTLLLIGNNDRSTADSYSPDSTGYTPAERRALRDRGNDRRTAGIVVTSLGATAVLTGAILYATGSNASGAPSHTPADASKKKSPVSWNPVSGFDQVGVQLNW